MKTRLFYLFAIVVFICGMDHQLYGQMPQTLSYQGMLSNVDGTSMTDQSLTLTFNLYDRESGGLSQWTETQRVQLEEGVFSVILGEVNPLDISFDQKLWMGVQIEDGNELSPRTKLSATAQSLTTLSVAPGAVVQSLNGIKDDVEIAAGDNVSLSQNGNKLTISASGGTAGGGGDITSVRAGEGLMGGGNQGDVRLSIAEGGITGDLIANNSINSAKIADESIQSEDIRNETLSGNKIASGQVVKSINGIKDNVEIVEGTNIDIRRDGNRIRISANDSGGSLPLEGSNGIEVATERNKKVIGLKTPLILKENIQNPLLDLENRGGTVLKASKGNSFVDLLSTEAGSAIYARNGGNSQIFLAGSDRAAEFERSPGIHVALCKDSEALFAYHSSHGTRASLATENAGVFGATPRGSPSYAGLFHGTVQIEGLGIVDGNLAVKGAVKGPTTFEGLGSGGVLINFNIERNWHLRQFGSGAGTALELASIGGGGNKNFLINTDGLVGIGTTAPRDKLHVAGAVMATAFNQSSSRRWKKDIQKIQGALDTVDKLQGVTYRWKEDDRADIGLIAEEVGAVIPEVVEFEDNGVDARSVDYGRLAPILIESIKELHAIAQRQQAEIDKLRSEINRP